jgi:hypothetical protein
MPGEGDRIQEYRAGRKDLTTGRQSYHLVVPGAANAKDLSVVSYRAWETLGDGGSYVKITAQSIENGTPGDMKERCTSWDKQDGNAMRQNPSFPAPKDLRFKGKGPFGFSQ